MKNQPWHLAQMSPPQSITLGLKEVIGPAQCQLRKTKQWVGQIKKNSCGPIGKVPGLPDGQSSPELNACLFRAYCSNALWNTSRGPVSFSKLCKNGLGFALIHTSKPSLNA